jgi:hypothetical protein
MMMPIMGFSLFWVCMGDASALEALAGDVGHDHFLLREHVWNRVAIHAMTNAFSSLKVSCFLRRDRSRTTLRHVRAVRHE